MSKAWRTRKKRYGPSGTKKGLCRRYCRKPCSLNPRSRRRGRHRSQNWGRVAVKIKRVPETGEYVVKLYVDGKHRVTADYFTNDRRDAYGTAKDVEDRASRYYGPRTPNPLPRWVDRRSIRTIYRGKGRRRRRLLIGCPKGAWNARRGRCRVGTRLVEKRRAR